MSTPRGSTSVSSRTDLRPNRVRYSLARVFRCVVVLPGLSNKSVTHDFGVENGCDVVDSAKQGSQRLCTARRQLSSGLTSDSFQSPVRAFRCSPASIG